MPAVRVCNAGHGGPGCTVKQDYVTLPHICPSSWGTSQVSVIHCWKFWLSDLQSLVFWCPLAYLIQAKMGNNWFVLVFNVYVNNKRAEIAAAEGDNALFTHLLSVAQLRRWSSDSTKLSRSSTAITAENFLEFTIISTQGNSAWGKKRVAGKQKLLICYHSLWKRSPPP